MSILIKPVVTEKATADSELNNRYTFLVNVNANKVEIKKTIEATYGVSVEKVRTMNYGPDRKVRYTKTGIQHVSNLSLLTSKGETTRVGYRMEEDKKVRFSKKSNEVI